MLVAILSLCGLYCVVLCCVCENADILKLLCVVPLGVACSPLLLLPRSSPSPRPPCVHVRVCVIVFICIFLRARMCVCLCVCVCMCACVCVCACKSVHDWLGGVCI